MIQQRRIPLALLLAGLIGCGAVGAQERGGKQERGAAAQAKEAASTAQEQTLHAKLDTLIGAPVALDREGTSPRGNLDDLLVDARTGHIAWAVVTFGGDLDKTVAVPGNTIRWRDDEGAFRLKATMAELKHLPPYDLEEARQRGIDASLVAIEASWKAVGAYGDEAVRSGDAVAGEAKQKQKQSKAKGESGQQEAAVEGAGQQDPRGTQPAVIIAGESYIAFPQRMLCASEIPDFPVHAKDAEFGTVSKVIVECSTRTVDMVVVERAGTGYLIPFAALTVRQGATDDNDIVYHVDRTVEAMEDSVRYEKPSKGLVDAADARQAREQYAVSKRKDLSRGR